jgi:hypothetical protein
MENNFLIKQKPSIIYCILFPEFGLVTLNFLNPSSCTKSSIFSEFLIPTSQIHFLVVSLEPGDISLKIYLNCVFSSSSSSPLLKLLGFSSSVLGSLRSINRILVSPGENDRYSLLLFISFRFSLFFANFALIRSFIRLIVAADLDSDGEK